MVEQFQFSNKGINDASDYLVDCCLDRMVNECVNETGAKVHEVLFMMLCFVEEIANDYGLPGPEFLAYAAQNRADFREEINDVDWVRMDRKRNPKQDDID